MYINIITLVSSVSPNITLVKQALVALRVLTYTYSGLPFVHGPLVHDIGYNTVEPCPPKKKSPIIDGFPEKF